MMKSNEEPGHPLEQISNHHQLSSESLEADAENGGSCVTLKDVLLSSTLPNLTPAQIQEPALLLDNNFGVVWQNQAAITHIWREAGISNNGDAQPSLLDLLFDPHFQHKVENWRQWAFFFIQQVCHMLSDQRVQKHLQVRDRNQQEILKEMLQQKPAVEDRAVYSGLIKQVLSDGQNISFGVVASQFQQGRFIVFRPLAKGNETYHAYQSTDIQQYFKVLSSHGTAVPMPIYILAARLNSADTFRTEMLVEEYSRLMTRLYRLCIDCIESYGGIFHKLAGSGFLVHFLPGGQQPLDTLQVLECALELKGKMSELGREWKIRKGWLHDLELNMGLHWAQEHISTIPSALGDNLIAFGSAQRAATLLCRLSRNGQIWATKEVINQIVPQDQKKIRFGSFRQGHPHQVLINKSFISIKDLAGSEPLSTESLENELAGLAITQIFDGHR